MKIVLGTNVLVAGILSPHGPPAALLRALLTERITLCFDERIISEYRDALTGDQCGFDKSLVDELIGFLEAAGWPTLADPLATHLPDPWDLAFLEVAIAGGVDYLIAGDPERFPEGSRAGLKIASPREFLDALIEGSPSAP